MKAKQIQVVGILRGIGSKVVIFEQLKIGDIYYPIAHANKKRFRLDTLSIGSVVTFTCDVYIIKDINLPKLTSIRDIKEIT